MDHLKILKRAFQITWNYRVLWIFGIILALTTGGGGGGNGGGSGNGSGGNGEFPWPGGRPPFPTEGFQVPGDVLETLSAAIPIIIGLVCFIFLLMVVFTILRYVAETALIRMVNEYEDSGEKVSIRQGFRLGWSRSALRLFLIDLIVGLASFIVFFILLLVALTPLLLWITGSDAARALGAVMAIGMVMLLVFVAIVYAIAMSLLLLFVRRAYVLEGLGIMDGFKRGFALVRQRVGDVLVMGILMFALGLLWAIAMVPVFILLALAGFVIAGLPALLIGGIASLFTQGYTPWIIAAAIGVPLYILILAAPLLFLSGLTEVFKSSTWTLTYRELLALESLQPEPVAELPEPTDEADEADEAPEA
ncbi:MAG: hypothetical protein AB1894_14015 [Chloroflexota bacterium]